MSKTGRLAWSLWLAGACTPQALEPQAAPTSQQASAYVAAPTCGPAAIGPLHAVLPDDQVLGMMEIDVQALQRSPVFRDDAALLEAEAKEVLDGMKACGVPLAVVERVVVGFDPPGNDLVLGIQAKGVAQPKTLDCLGRVAQKATGKPAWTRTTAGCTTTLDIGGEAKGFAVGQDVLVVASRSLADAVERGTMPPFAADESAECEMHYGWQDDLRLDDEQKQRLRAWADAGAPEGDPATAAPIEPPPSVALTEVDDHLEIDGAVTIGGTQDRFLCFSLDPGLTEDRYLGALQIVPGNDRIVHHVLVFVDDDGSTADLPGPDGSYPCSGGGLQGDLIGAWAPGMLPTRTPEGVGMPVPAGARLVLNVHYHPTGAGDELDDATGLELDWLDERPAWAAQLALFGNGQGLLPGPNDDGGPQFVIPPGASDHTEAMLMTLPANIPEVRLWEIGAHMHYLGVDMIIGVRRHGSPGPEEECLLHATRYSFEWQRLYA
ncbi:MAG: hypothetical protein KDK70_37770, partial [Myxococcales bacterium]|nr:hypothetical protein [Myxococcales bacterium]